MRNIYTTIKLALLTVLSAVSVNGFSQTFSAWSTGTTGAFDVYTSYNDTMRFTFTGLPAGAYGMAKLVVYYQGDYGDAIESAQTFLAATPTGANIAMLGTNGPVSAGGDCAPEDSVVLMFNTSLLTPLGSSVAFKNIPNNNVDPSTCTNIRTRLRLEFNYCALGVPSEYAHAIVSNGEVCPSELVNLSGTPTGGTFSGPGVTGNTFDPSSLPTGVYTITYTATDGIGCTTTDDTTIRILNSPSVDDYIVCYGDSANIVPNAGASFIYYTDLNLTDPIDTTLELTYGPLTSTTTLYVQNNDADFSFNINTLLATPTLIVDHGTLAGDDRGGIAVTQNYVYVNGDVGVARFDLNLTPGSGVACPQRDGIFSDLASGTLYTLWNTTTNAAPVNPGSYTINAIREMDDMLAFTGNILPLTSPITLNSGSSIYAGAGILILFHQASPRFYVIDINTGEVTDMGPAMASPTPYATENWLRWGVAEYDGSQYSVVYRNTSGAFISRMNISSGTVTTLATFTSLGDMASITYSPWESKWYWKYEGGGGQWGGTTETLGKLDGTHSYALLASGGIGCASDIELTVPSITIAGDETFCEGESTEFTIGLGYTSITWNGDNTNLNSYSTSGSGEVIVEAVEASTGCTVMDTVDAIMNPMPNVTFSLPDDHACNTDNVFALTGGMPAGGIYSGPFVTGTNFNPFLASNGVHVVTYTYTDANGCMNSDQAGIFVDGCLGLDEMDNNMISLYPNPAQNNITINAGSFVNQLVNIEVYDAQGKVVYSEKSTLNQNHVLNVSALNNGIYHVSLSVEGNRSMARLVIQK